MAGSFSCRNLIVFCLILIPLVPSCPCADPPPLQDFCVADLNSNIYVNGYPCKNPSEVTADDFLFEGFSTNDNVNKVFNIYGLNATFALVAQFPGLNTLGISMLQVVFQEGGVIPPHTHPLASELVYVVKGKVLIGFVTTNNALFYKILTPKMVFLIPQALLHFQLNVGKGKATILANFNGQNPGFQFVSQALFNTTPSIPNDVLRESFRVNNSIVGLLKYASSAPLIR